jgi:hypothetical protein
MINGKLELTEDSLMVAAENRYNSLKETTAWKKGSEKDERIMALTARLEKLEAKKKETKEKKNKKQSRKEQKGRKPKWVNNPPKAGEPKTKKVDGKTYYWCPAHKAWVQHSPEDCRLKATPSGDKKNTTNDGASDAQLRFAKALATIIEANYQEE